METTHTEIREISAQKEFLMNTVFGRSRSLCLLWFPLITALILAPGASQAQIFFASGDTTNAAPDVANLAFGYNALFANTTGTNNTSIGYQTLSLNTTGASNTASGFQALFNNLTGGSNTAN